MKATLCDICGCEVTECTKWPGGPPRGQIYKVVLLRPRQMVLCPRCEAQLVAVICCENKKDDWKRAIRNAMRRIKKTASAGGFEEKEKAPQSEARGETE